MSEFENLDGLGMAELVKTGQVTPAALLEDAIERITKANPAVNAVITTLYDEARAEVAGPIADGPFQGVPFLLKDGGAVGVAGTRLTSGSRYLMDNISKEDGELYLRYKAAGLVACGKTNMPEFGLQPTTEPEAFGPTRNPWNLDLTAGGSSGGAAAAVATRMVPIAHASDSGGSIRIPASCCGVFGMKPTRLRITSSRRHLGVSARMSFLSENAISLTVRDSAALLDASAGPGFADPFQAPRPERPYLSEVGADPGRLRIVVSNESPTGVPLDGHAVAAVEDAARLCESLGHHVEYGVPKLDLGGIAGPFGVVTAHGLAWDIARLEQLTGKVALEEHFEPATWDLIMRGRTSTATVAEYADGLAALQALSEDVQRFQQPYDIWLTPTAGSAPPALGSFSATAEDPTRGMRAAASYLPFTTLINVTGQPAMSVPLYWTADDIPVGAHFVAPYGDEGMLFRLAAQLEAARPWAGRKPLTAA
ncbi:amidase [Nocardioides marmoriginsengisoli]|uniref:Amidase n=1 Tax=Nocardioides marmoriginsengisoli TaxID=661483 RepID=A0A3N0CGE0_9ACTN|nr:amidase [Nocardioides marmoriginsengisoli]RNL62507.1 amidase [Nocardioides marmoriginsengisoli]